jgi:AP-1 complex subunit beta-1
VKKVIANMTVGKDVSTLFADVVNCIQTDNLELKKLVYLYLINYAKSNPDLALLAVNTFVKDCNDPNPLIRALAIRTMGCIRVDKITEYLCEPLARCLKDEDPYVRKTAAVCVAKLYDISPELVEDRGFLDTLRDLISDANPTVVANAIAALSEIMETSGKDVMMVNATVLQKLLAALNECTEWGQVFILDSLSRYVPSDAREAEGIIERVSPRLQHSNSAVVMSAVKVILKYMDEISTDPNHDVIKGMNKKLTPPLITLLNTEPETQYVALRNINLIVQKRPEILMNEIKVFFCKYNDPIYVKMEKLEIIIRLAREKNIDQVLLEFKEYATEVDVEFVRKALRAIGRCAIKLERAAERCISVLLELIQTKVNYVVQEGIVVIKDIFRKYPNRYEGIIATLCENLEDLDEPEAKASMVWIIGEYAERIDGAEDLLESFLETFQDETASVQLQLLTATVKLFLKQPDNTQEMVQRVLNMATEDSDNPDLRDRGYVYWRLLSSDPEAARAVVLSEKPEIQDDTFTLDPTLLEDLMSQIATLASIYHKPPESFVMKNIAQSTVEEEDYDDDLMGGLGASDGSSNNSAGGVSGGGGGGGGGGGDLLDLMGDGPAPQQSNDGNYSSSGGGSDGSSNVQKTLYLAADAGKGLSIQGGMVRSGDGGIRVVMDISNASGTSTQALAIQLNKNTFGLAPVNPQMQLPQSISNGGSVTNVTLDLKVDTNQATPDKVSGTVQSAIKNMASGDVVFFHLPVQLEALFVTGASPDAAQYAQSWKSIGEEMEVSQVLSNLPSADISTIKGKLTAAGASFVAERQIPGTDQTAVYFGVRLASGANFLLEVKFKAGANLVKVTIKSPSKEQSDLVKTAVAKVITA